MEYISNGQYKLEINGTELIASIEELQDALTDLMAHDGHVEKTIEAPNLNYLYEDDGFVSSLESIRDEVREDTLDSFVETALECAAAEALEYYSERFYMIRKGV